MPTKFDFVSPGIELREIDQSTVTSVPENDGILLIGRAKKGPAMKPIKITSLTNFHEVFGTPMDGVKQPDPWRDGNTGTGGWAAYAAEAYLAAGVGPVKFIRLAGEQTDSAGTTEKAGWSIDQANFTSAPIADIASTKGALGIFVGTNSTPVASTTAGAVLTIGDMADVQNHFAVDDTLTVNFVAGDGSLSSYVYTFAAAPAPGNLLVIDFNAVNLGTATSSATALVTLIQAHLNDVSVDDFIITDNLDGTIDFDLQVAGTVGNDLTIDFVVSPIQTPLTGTPTAGATFGGGTNSTPIDGVLAGILYVNGVQAGLYGTTRDSAVIASADPVSATAIVGTSAGWNLVLEDSSSQTETYTFNFNETSQNFIRSSFNTDPTLFEDGYGQHSHNYFLGETFEHNVNRLSSTSTNLVAWVAGIEETHGSADFTNHQQTLTEAKTGWFIGSTPTQKPLFRLAALDEGGSFHKNYIVRIKDLREASNSNPDATFTIEIARTDSSAANHVEKFSGVTLNVNSPNYISKKIGDLNQSWSPTKEKIITTGVYNNVSDLVRVEIHPGANKGDLPVGFTGPAKIGDATIIFGDTTIKKGWIAGKNLLPNANRQSAVLTTTLDGLLDGDTVTVKWPTHELTVQNSYIRSGNYPASSLFGLSYQAQRGNEDYADIGYAKKHFDPHLDATAAVAGAAYVFTLNDLKSTAGRYYFDAGTDTGDITTLIAAGAKQFAAPFFGGTDGTNILLENPFNETELIANGYAQYSMESALSQVADSDIIRYDMISIPGVTTSAIIQDLILQTENRGDALAIVDAAGIYQSEEDHGSAEQVGSVNLIVAEIDKGTFNSSYAATYYPNVRLADVSSGNGSILMAPPSVAGIGAIAKSEAQSQPWFAPAGFNRGGLAPLGGVGGPSVVGTFEHLNKADRDALYDVNINPIARFPATGDTVIFGQKTLQQSASALDRINVRRMMIHLKKRIGDIAKTILFEQSVSSTFDKFKANVDPVLSTLQNEFGVSEYKIVLDETTTTPDLQDRNIMYAKVFVKPAKAIEFIAVDFVITQSGVEF